MTRHDTENPEFPSDAARRPGAVLAVEVLEGEDAGARLRFPVPGSFVLGRRGTPDLALRLLADPSLQARHLLVTVTDGERIRLDRLGPSGTTRVGGRALTSAYLSSGALVELGATTARLSIERDDVIAGRVRRARLAEYQLVEEIGQGAFSRVYDAVERASGERVAVKRLLLGEAEDREMRISAFLREVETAATLEHPGIVGVRAAGRTGDEVFLVLDFVDGPDLDAWVEIDGPLDENGARRVAAGLLDALAYAHECGVLHRDVKPSNVMLAPEEPPERPILVDFGLAVRPRLDATWGLTRSGDLRGTPDFLAPECLFDAQRHSVRADLYGVGATLYYAVTGRTPQAGGEPGAARPALASLRPDLGADLVHLVEKALSRDPANRWNAAGAMRAALVRA